MIRVLRMSDVDLKGKRVLIREDLNVPVKDGVVTSDARIVASMPTIEFALKAGAKVMVTSHLGRPTEGEFKPEDSLAPIAKRMSELLGCEVPLRADWVNGVEVAPGNVGVPVSSKVTEPSTLTPLGRRTSSIVRLPF